MKTTISAAWPHYRSIVRKGKAVVLLPTEIFEEVASAARPKGHHRIGMNQGGPTSGLCEVTKDNIRFLWDYTCWESNWPVFADASTVDSQQVVWKLPYLQEYKHVLDRLNAGISDELAAARGINQRNIPLAKSLMPSLAAAEYWFDNRTAPAGQVCILAGGENFAYREIGEEIRKNDGSFWGYACGETGALLVPES